MPSAQPGILEDVPPMGRYIVFDLLAKPDIRDALEEVLISLASCEQSEDVVVGIGQQVVATLGASIAGLRELPPSSGSGVSIPSTPAALWLWMRGDDRGDLIHQSEDWIDRCEPAFIVREVIDSFMHRDSRDLTGYVDGTENPTGDDATKAAVLASDNPNLSGSSFVAVQRWHHNLREFAAMPQSEQDNTFGRRISDNSEIEDAPVSAHVKRTAQEDFQPEAFLLRRSMPWAEGANSGLVFVAFGRSFDAFEAQLNRMAGHEDGVVDALFRFTQPHSGSYFWCPPVEGGRLNLKAIGVDGD